MLKKIEPETKLKYVSTQMPKKEHPKRATSEHTQCLGYSKDHRRCRLERDANSKTCSIHRNYYRDWWYYTFRPFSTMEWASKRQKAEYEFQIQNDHVQVPERIIQDLRTSDLKLYRWFIRVAHIDPLLNRRCFIHNLSYPVDSLLMAYTISEERIQTCVEEIRSMLVSPKCCEEAFSILVHRALANMKFFNYMISPERRVEFWDQIFSNIKEWTILLKSPAYINCLDEFEKKFSTIGTAFLNTENMEDDIDVLNVDELTQILNEFRHVVRLSLDSRCTILREKAMELQKEFARRAFAPERVARLLEAGYEIEDI